MTVTKKRTLFLLTILVVAVVTVGYAQRHSRSKTASLLWKINGKGLAHPSYLFGTIHMICADKFLWTSAMKRALDSCQQVAFELDMDDPQLAVEVSAGMMLPEGVSLEDYFTPEAYERLKSYAADTLNIPEAALDRMQPFAVLSMAAMKSGQCFGRPVSYEERISAWAGENNREVVGIESAVDQLAVMEEMNKDSTARQILRILNHPKMLHKQYKQLLHAYLRQDLNDIYRLIINAPDMQSDLQTLLYDRNEHWVPKIEALIREQPTFIAVGAGHLAGDSGVIQLLQEAGYEVTPVY